MRISGGIPSLDGGVAARFLRSARDVVLEGHERLSRLGRSAFISLLFALTLTGASAARAEYIQSIEIYLDFWAPHYTDTIAQTLIEAGELYCRQSRQFQYNTEATTDHWQSIDPSGGSGVVICRITYQYPGRPPQTQYPYGLISYHSKIPGCPADQGWTLDSTQRWCTRCPANQLVSGTQCLDNTSAAKQAGETCPATAKPIALGTGNKYLVESDYAAGGVSGLGVTRTYNSAPSNRTRYDLATKWSLGLLRAINLDSASSPTVAVAVRPDGKALKYVPSGANWVADADVADRLVQLKSGATSTGWRYFVAADSSVEEYDASGLLLRITLRTGQVLNFSASNGSGGIQYAVTPHVNGYQAPACTRPGGFSVPTTAGVLVCVSDTQGRQINFSYDASGRISKFADPAGLVTQYGLDASNNLSSVTYPDGSVRRYLYENAGFPNHLTGITDENGNRYATYGYNGSGKAVSEALALGAEAAALTFGTNSTTVTDALGTARTYNFQTVLNVARSTGSSQPGGSGCGPASSGLTYDANGNVSRRTDFNGNVTTYTYDLTRNLETSRVEASGSAVARTLSTQWHSVWRLPVKLAQPLKLTTWVYNGDSYNSQTVTCAPAGATIPSASGPVPIAVLCKKVEQATQDATGSQGFGAAATGTARIWNWTYDQYGQMLTADGPRTDASDVTTITYYAVNDPNPGNRGNVATITNALGHVTQITAYDANGRPLTIVDPNGLVTTLTYDLRGRLTSKDAGGEVTSYQYDGVGQLTKLTLPDGAWLGYTYDAAHRLTAVADNLGNQTLYTLDLMGNRTKEDVKDPANQLARTRSRAFDALNRLYRDIGAQNQVTQYAYDANGNLTSTTDPLNHVATRAYDALDRLVRITDPAGGQTVMGYDGQGRLTQVTDPRSLVTGYTIDGLGNLTQLASPDTGTTTQAFDAAGNRTGRTDARSQTATTQYDALNRPTQVTYGDGRQELYTWDQGANGLGRLGLIQEVEGGNVTATIGYAYDAWGRVLTETRTLAGQSYVTSYRYAGGRLTGVTYPSGRRIDYALDGAGRIQSLTLTDNGVVRTVASQVQYHPFGGIKSYVTASGQTVSRTQDQDGRIAAYTLGTGLWQVGYDAASRVSYATDAGNAANTASYVYDTLDRLTGAILPTTNYGYGYDATGNRTSQTVGGTTYAYQIGATSNRLTGINTSPPRSYAYDAAGNRTGDGTLQFGYDARGRMVQAQGAIDTTQYRVDALGQRVRKTNTTGDTVYHYDRDGHLIGETNAAGQSLRDYVWLYDLPIGVLQ